MSLTTIPVVENNGAALAVVQFETASRIELPAAVASALVNGGVLIGLETSGDGAAGLTSSGLINYRPALDHLGDETVTIRYLDARGAEKTVALTVATGPGLTDDGWSDGEHYMLARDADGWNIAEPGQNHRVVYVSPDGKANADGLTPETAVTPAGLDRLLDTLRIDPAAGKGSYEKASWHVLFERDQYYGDFELPKLSGEDPLHPFVIGAYGEGDRPLFASNHSLYGTGENAVSNLLVRDIAFGFRTKAEADAANLRVRGLDMIGAGHENIMYENVYVTAVNSSPGIQSASSNITLYRFTTVDTRQTEPSGDDWMNIGKDRISGLFISRADGVLVLESLADHNAWEEGYDPTGALTDYQPPSKFSHNVYIDHGVSNLTYADNISSNGASFGAQLRPSGAVYGNVFFGNNAGMNMLGGKFEDGRFTDSNGVLIDTIITAPGLKDSREIGALGWGSGIAGPGLAVDYIVAQDGDGLGSGPRGVANPMNDNLNDGVKYQTEGVTIFNWGKTPDQTLAGADLETMLAATIENFAALRGGDLDDLIAALRSRDRDDWSDGPDAADIVAYFRDAFAYDSLVTPSGRSVTFEADSRAEGFRWDNRLNWTGDRLPQSGDAVFIDGHAVTYGLDTLWLAKLDLGQGGTLRVAQALVDVRDLTVGSIGGAIAVSDAGQFLMRGYADSDALSMTVSGGRIANTGAVTGDIDIVATGGQLLLAEGGGSFRLDADDALVLRGDAARVGFDGGSGDATLVIDGGVLRFELDETGVSSIGEFMSGRHGAIQSGVRSIIDMRSGVLEIDLSDYDPKNGQSITLLSADVFRGGLANLDVRLTGVPNGYEARVGVSADGKAIGVSISGDGPPPPPPSGGGSTPVIDTSPIFGWEPPAIDDADSATTFTNLKVDWSAAATSMTTVFVAQGAFADWGTHASWLGGVRPTTDDWVQLRGRSAEFDDGVLGSRVLHLGSDGALRVSGGLLEAASLRASGSNSAISVVDGGQFVFAGYASSSALALEVDGGRAVNTGAVTGPMSAIISAGQLLLGEGDSGFRIDEDASLTIIGDEGIVGFDGASGEASLRLDGGTLRFVADATGVSAIHEFDSGRSGAGQPGVRSVLDIDGGVIEVDLSAYDLANGRAMTLIDVDEIVGDIGSIEFVVTGAPDGYFARLGVNLDLGAIGVALFAGTPTSGGGSDAGKTFEPLAVDWSTAAKPTTATFEGPGQAWSDAENWFADRAPVTGDWGQVIGRTATFDGGVLGLSAMNLGSGGDLTISDGLLETRSLVSDASRISVVDDGQFVFSGYRRGAGLEIDVAGGRAVNVGTVENVMDVNIYDGQMLLAETGAEFRLVDGSTILIDGDAARIGFDGAAGDAVLSIAGGALRFVADETGVSTISEFTSGRHGVAAPALTSKVVLNNGLIEVDLSDYDPRSGDQLVLMDVDTIQREFISYYDLDTRIIGVPVGYAARFDIDEAQGLMVVDLEQTIIF